MAFVSYAQNSEDVLLHRVFGGQGTGFYIDVGAYHPVDGSVTKAFYDRGWSGINVEPGSVFAELAQARTRDVNLQMAVLDRAGEVAFIENQADRGTSHVELNRSEKEPRRMVPCDTLMTIAEIYCGRRPIDFIKIDVEGAEAAIVCSTNWRALRSRVLLIEATLPWSSALANQEWEPALLEQGYVRVYFDGINCFYVPEEEVPSLQRHFQAPVNALDGFVTAQCEAFRLASYQQHEKAVSAAAERDAIRDQLMQAVTERDSLHNRLEGEDKKVVQATAECDALRRALQSCGIETARLTSECEALRSAIESERKVVEQLSSRLEAAHTEFARLTAEHEASLASARTEIARLTSEHEASLASARAEIARLTAEHEASLTTPKLRELEASAAAPNPVSIPSRSKRVARRLAFGGYLLVRPIARPLAWRTRSFLVGRLHDELQSLMKTSCTRDGIMAQLVGRLRDELQSSRHEISQLVEGLHNRAMEVSATAEMRSLATEMERILYSVAIERGPSAWSHTDAVTPRTASV
jgi:FkbM family methyltransferase